MGVAGLEGERELLADTEVIRGRDAGNEGTGVASQVEIGFRTQRLNDFNHGFQPRAPTESPGEGGPQAMCSGRMPKTTCLPT